MSDMIKCLKCKELKTEDSFDLYKICTSCLNQSQSEKKREIYRAYYIRNRDKIQQRKCIFREKHREIINAKANEKIECENCHCFIRRNGMPRHKKTNKCQNAGK